MDYKKSLEEWKARRELIIRMYNSGSSCAEITQRMNISRQRLYQILRGNTRRAKHVSPLPELQVKESQR